MKISLKQIAAILFLSPVMNKEDLRVVFITNGIMVKTMWNQF